MSALVATSRREANGSLLDGRTPLHVAVGLLGGLCGTSLLTAVLGSLGAEILVIAARRGPDYALFGKARPASSLGNQAVDVAATSGGYYLGRWLRERPGRAGR